MSININILNLAGRKKIIRERVEKTLRKIKNKISPGKLEIVIKMSSKPLKESGGIGGYCPSGNYIELNMDLESGLTDKKLFRNLEKSLLHELHHAVRRQSGINMEQGHFVESLVSEGLADFFVFETMKEKPVWIVNIRNRREKLRELKKILEKNFNLKYYEDWFIKGSVRKKIKKWTGYSLGFEIMKNYIVKNNLSSTDLIKIPAEKIFKNKKIDDYI